MMLRLASSLAFMTLVAQESAAAQTLSKQAPAQQPTLTQRTSVPPPPPRISGHDARGCVAQGQQLLVRGEHLGPREQRQIVLSEGTVHVDLPVSGWRDTAVAVTIPADPRLVPGQRYRLGIEVRAHGPWISNLDQFVVICAAAASAQPRPAPIDPARPAALVRAGEEQAEADGGAGTGTPPPVNPFSGGGGQRPDYSVPGVLQSPMAADPVPSDAEPGELLVWHADLATAQEFASAIGALGYSVRRRQLLVGLDVVQTVVGLPADVDLPSARDDLQSRFAELLLDANHRYGLLAKAAEEARLAGDLVGWSPGLAQCGTAVRVGVIDTSVARDHPAFAGRDVVVHRPLPAGIQPANEEHGTLVAARLAELLPGAQLRVAAVFRVRDDDVVDTTAEWLIAGLDWLLREGAEAINLSLGGPENRLLAAGITRAMERGVGLVAAIGDGGSKSAPVYPAGWDGVIGVTAVDRQLRVHPKARQGDDVDFAAPGVDLWAMRADGSALYVTGTSHAAPFVTAAWLLAGSSERLARAARDLGAVGRDPVYGLGLVYFDQLCEMRGQ
jgi:hypothetical protein